jgi:hypothetical protein
MIIIIIVCALPLFEIIKYIVLYIISYHSKTPKILEKQYLKKSLHKNCG